MKLYDAKTVDTFFTLIWPVCINNGLSVVAVDDASGRVAGAFTAYDEDAFEKNLGFCQSISLMIKLQSFAQIIQLFDDINKPLTDEHKKLVKEKKEKSTGFKCDYHAVVVNSDFAKRGIATHLTNLVSENAIKQGFKVGYAQCTS